MKPKAAAAPPVPPPLIIPMDDDLRAAARCARIAAVPQVDNPPAGSVTCVWHACHCKGQDVCACLAPQPMWHCTQMGVTYIPSS